MNPGKWEMWGNLRDLEELESFHINTRGCRDPKPAAKAEGSYCKTKCFSFPCTRTVGELPSAPTSNAEVSPGTAAKLVWEPSRAIFP